MENNHTEEKPDIEVPAEGKRDEGNIHLCDIPAPEPETPHIQTGEEDRKEIILGAALGVLTGLIMFIVPNRYIEERTKLFLCIVVIILGRRLIMDKLHLEFKKGRYAMAGALFIILIIYILMGHPVN